MNTLGACQTSLGYAFGKDKVELLLNASYLVKRVIVERNHVFTLGRKSWQVE